MDSLISTFHLDIKEFIAQLVNFGLVFFVLYYFAFKPLFKVMGERTAKIAKSLKDADAIKDRLAATETEQAAIIASAKKEANLIIEEADKRGEARRNELVEKAKEDIGQLMDSERAKIDQDKAVTLKEIKGEVSDLVVLTVEKLLQEKMDSAKDQKIIKDLIK